MHIHIYIHIYIWKKKKKKNKKKEQGVIFGDGVCPKRCADSAVLSRISNLRNPEMFKNAELVVLGSLVENTLPKWVS